jgi:hypothetical protein
MAFIGCKLACDFMPLACFAREGIAPTSPGAGSVPALAEQHGGRTPTGATAVAHGEAVVLNALTLSMRVRGLVRWRTPQPLAAS